MKARAFIVACGAASLFLPLACTGAAADQAEDAPQYLQAGPRIIHIPEPPKHAPNRHVERPQKPAESKPHVEQPQPPLPPEPKRKVEQPLQPAEPAESVAPKTAQPAPSQAPATPTVKRPASTKANRKIWI